MLEGNAYKQGSKRGMELVEPNSYFKFKYMLNTFEYSCQLLFGIGNCCKCIKCKQCSNPT